MKARFALAALLITMVALPAVSLAQEIQPPPPDRPQRADRDRNDRGDRNDRRERWREFMKRFDKDGDGQINAEERKAVDNMRRQHRLLEDIDLPQDKVDELRKAADANGDGKLDGNEYRDLYRKHRDAEQAYHKEIVKKYDADEDGTLNEEERLALTKDREAEEFKKMDTDGDGKVTLEEWTAARDAAREKAQAQRDERMQAWRAMREARRDRDRNPEDDI